MPSSHCSQNTTSPPCSGTPAAILGAFAPSTTATRASGAAAIASSTCSSSGLPSSRASCFGPPKRDEPPAASTRPPIMPLRTYFVDAARRIRQPAPVTPVPHGHDLAHDRERGLLRGEPPEVEPDRGGDPGQVVLRQPVLKQALAPLLLRAPRPHRADVGGLRAHRDLECG